jgi:xylan 1,4-beta-xylosidase
VTRPLVAVSTILAVVTLAAQNVNPPSVTVPAVSEPRVDPVRDSAKPALFLVGDSTVKNHSAGEGWGDYLAPFVGTAKVQVLNWAMGGRSSRSFIEEGRWARVLAQVVAGDVILVQFGHNDQRELTSERGTILSAGDEVRTVLDEATRREVRVRTFGSYLRTYIRDARIKGARIALLSPVPRDYWKDGRFDNVMREHAALMRQVADRESVPFIDLNASLTRSYLELGEKEVTTRFFTVGDFTHTNAEGAQFAALAVVDGLRSHPQLGVADWLRPSSTMLTLRDMPLAWAAGIEGQRRADLGNGFYLNPILAGDHPDPSILKDGNEYYMTFSSFEAYPGLVIWHSRDLINWAPLAPALTKNVGSVWAPDLVKHDGRYYIYFPGIGPYRSNYVIWADDIHGPWSEPIDLKNRRIDPGHAVGPDGRRYLFLSGGYLVELSPDGLSIVGGEKKIYDGWPYPKEWIVETFAQEGPKVLKRGDFYYQVLAQGGTAGPATGHMIVAARSRTIEGPWEHSPYNPILRTQSADERWWSKGHGTLVEGPDQRWWIVYHAYENGFYNLGRQTLLEPIEWLSDGWFRSAKYDPGRPIPKPIPTSNGAHGFALSDDFSADKMGVQWSFYGGDAADRQRYRYENGSLVLRAKGTSPADSSPIWFVTGDRAYEFEVDVEADSTATAGVLVFYNRKLYGGLGYSAKNLVLHTYGSERPTIKPPQLGQRLHLRLRNDRHIVSLYYSVDGRTWDTFDRRLEVSGYHHNVAYDFLSLRPALYAAGSGEVRFRNFKYRALPGS